MSSLNRVTLIGRLGKDPEVRTFQSGGRVVSFSLATSERWKDRDGNQQEKTTWHSIAVFNEKLGEIAERFLKKGSLVFVEGMLTEEKWTDKDGQERKTAKIVLRPFNGQIVLLPNGSSDRDEERGERSGGTPHRESSWDSGGGRAGGEKGGTYTHPAGSNRGSREFDDDVPF